MSNDPSQDYFSDGITEDITGDLSQISSLFVIARNSAFTYKGKAVKVQDVSKELGVRYVLEGSVRKADNQVRITAQLIDATTGGHVWSERYDRPLTDIFALQDEIVQQLVANLRVEVLEAELVRVRHVPTENLTAYEALLRGWESFLRLSQETNMQARRLFEKAIELDPAYAQAYVGLGYTYWQEWPSQWSQDPKTLDQALVLAQKARELDGSLPHVYLLLSDVYLFQKQHDQAIAAAERAIALAPSLGDGYSRLGHVLHWAGRPEEAIEWLKKGRRLDPRNPVPYLISLAESYRLLRRYEEAIATYRRALQFSANLIGPHFFLAVIYSELDREEEARAEATEILRISPNFSVEVARRRLPFKDPAEVEHVIDALHKAGLK
jgi:TolB-like protein/Tfp pilus assembly protein PilF